MKILLSFLLLITTTSFSQTNLLFGEIKGKSINNCKVSKDGKICNSKYQLEIWLTEAAVLIAQYNSVRLVYDGVKWSATKYKGDWAKNTVDTFNLKPVKSFDLIFAALKENNIFLLPNQDSLSVKGTVDDGYDYDITFKAGDKFRSYQFHNPRLYIEENRETPEFTNYINIIDILFKWLIKE